MTLLINCLMIFVVRIIDVSLGTIRTVLTVRGKRMIGAVIGFVEILVWFFVVREALTATENSFWIAIAYAGGFSAGTFVGSWLEEKLAIGSATVTVITRGLRYDLVEFLREKGFGVSSVVCQGRNDENLMLLIEVGRKKTRQIRNIVNQIAPDSFITIADTKQIINGYFSR